MRIFIFILLIILFLCLGIFSKILYTKHNDNLAHSIKLNSIFNEEEILDLKTLIGKPYMINIFASWCNTCFEEHKVLLEIANSNDIAIYGIVYLDNKEKIKTWLGKYGNPYTIVSMDINGSIGKILGITAIPETFVFNKNGKIIFHVEGNITFDIWNNEIRPLII